MGAPLTGRLAVAAATLLIGAACSNAGSSTDSADGKTVSADEKAVRAAAAGEHATAIFAGGCFWCMESPFDQLDGVISTTSGYTGGTKVDPTYKEVTTGGTGHAEAVEVIYDPSRVTYDQLLDVFWQNVDPVDAGGQFCDRGNQYRTAIFFGDAEQRRLAEQSKQMLTTSQRFEQPIATEIVSATAFYPAEDYHQDYAEKNPVKYRFYRLACGRDRRLAELWGEQAGGH